MNDPPKVTLRRICLAAVLILLILLVVLVLLVLLVILVLLVVLVLILVIHYEILHKILCGNTA